MKMDRENEIRLIAYQIWEEQGCLDGYDVDHWLIAETLWEQDSEKAKESAGVKPAEKVEIANVRRGARKTSASSVRSKTKAAEPKARRTRQTKKNS
jgi:hypothetical protein